MRCPFSLLTLRLHNQFVYDDDDDDDDDDEVRLADGLGSRTHWGKSQRSPRLRSWFER